MTKASTVKLSGIEPQFLSQEGVHSPNGADDHYRCFPQISILGTTCYWGDLYWMPEKNVFTIYTIRHWNKLPQKVVDSPTLDGFKTQLDRLLGQLI